MARTRTQWETEIATALPSLSTSAVAEWKLFRDLVITIAVIFEAIIELFKKDIDNALATKQAGGLLWYAQITKEFQNGDSLQVNELGVLSYPIINTANRIISQASVKENYGVVMFKVAKVVGNTLQALNSTELTNFKNYIAARKFPGTATASYSSNADVITYAINGFFDPAYDQTAVHNSLLSALASFRNNFRFDAMFYKSGLIAELEGVPGIVWVDIVIDMSLSDGNTVTNLQTYKELPAGYFNWANTGNTISLTPAP